MQVILFKSVDNLGSAGEVVNVKPGYFRNYLGPRGYAQTVSKQSMALMESRRKKIELMVERERGAARAAAGQLDGLELHFELRANDKGQLFGSVTTTDIAKALGEQGHEVDRRKIELSEHIKSVGKFPVRVRLYPQVYAEVTVEVARLFRPEELEAIEEAERRAEATRAAAIADLEAGGGYEDDDDEGLGPRPVPADAPGPVDAEVAESH